MILLRFFFKRYNSTEKIHYFCMNFCDMYAVYFETVL